MTLRKLANIGLLAAGEQPNEADLARLAAEGFKSIVNLRLSGETQEGLTPDLEAVKAAENGLNYIHLPISMDTLSSKDVHSFHDAVTAAAGPVYVHCGLGQRAATLALLIDAERSGTPAEAAIDAVEQQGFGLSEKTKDFVRRYLRVGRNP